MGHTCSGGTSGCSCNSKFDGTFACLYSDKAFTSFKLAKMLAARKTYLLGMLRTSGRPKPTSMPLGEVDADGAANYWPFRGYSKKELEEWERGYARRAYTKLKAGDIDWLMTELWRDARWVTLLGTAYMSEEETTVRRWVKEHGERREFKCSEALLRYNKYMGAVDQFNKMLAATRMGMGRCKQRFHRALFLGWLLPAVGVVNVRTAFCELVKTKFGGAALASITNGHGFKDFNRWFQRTLGKLLIRRGTTEASVEEGGDEPHFMPMTRRLHWERPLLLPPPPDHGITHGKPVNVKKNDKSIPVPGKNVVKGKKSVPSRWFKGEGRCHLCRLRATRAAREAGIKVKDVDLPIAWTPLMCRICKVRLCKFCWDDWHQREAPQHLRECQPCRRECNCDGNGADGRSAPREDGRGATRRGRSSSRKPNPPKPFRQRGRLARARDAEESEAESQAPPPAPSPLHSMSPTSRRKSKRPAPWSPPHHAASPYGAARRQARCNSQARARGSNGAGSGASASSTDAATSAREKQRQEKRDRQERFGGAAAAAKPQKKKSRRGGRGKRGRQAGEEPPSPQPRRSRRGRGGGVQ